MIILFSIVLLLCILGIKKTDKSNDRDYMSAKMTNSIKGFFLCMVFFSHICGYANFTHPYLDYPFQVIRQFTGQCIVTMFLFYSGYGITESIKAKGQSYVQTFPIHRFLRVLLLFDCAIILFWIYRYITGNRYGLKKMLLTFLGWEGIGNSNWYIFCILWTYIFTYIAFSTFKNNYLKAVIYIFILSILYMAIMCNPKLGREHWWYDTILCYSMGMLFSLFRNNIEHWVNESLNSWLFHVVLFILGFIAIARYKNNSIIYQLWVFCFVASIVTFTMRFVIDSIPLQWIGRNLFELYILQRLPMLILKPYVITEKSTIITKYVYVLTCFVLTLLIAIIYKRIVSNTIKKLTSNQH